jgi:DMSO/TMAO reductase YedYZ heme-binding membrane subunit
MDSTPAAMLLDNILTIPMRTMFLAMPLLRRYPYAVGIVCRQHVVVHTVRIVVAYRCYELAIWTGEEMVA